MAFLALAAPAFLGGLVTGFFRPPLPFRKGKKGGAAFNLWPELAQVFQPSRLRQLKLSLSRISRPKCWLTTHGAWGHDSPCHRPKAFTFSTGIDPLQGKHEVLRLGTVHSSAHGRLQLPLLACAGSSEERHEGTYHVPFLCRSWRTANDRKKPAPHTGG